jgi:hypothetical protein
MACDLDFLCYPEHVKDQIIQRRGDADFRFDLLLVHLGACA